MVSSEPLQPEPEKRRGKRRYLEGTTEMAGMVHALQAVYANAFHGCGVRRLVIEVGGMKDGREFLDEIAGPVRAVADASVDAALSSARALELGPTETRIAHILLCGSIVHRLLDVMQTELQKEIEKG